MRRIIKIIFVVILSLTLIITFVFQIKAEAYKKQAQKDYGVFLNRKRKKFTPYLFFELNNKINRPYEEFRKYIDEPYKIQGYYEGYLLNINYGLYFTCCFYSLEELEDMKNEIPIERRMPKD